MEKRVFGIILTIIGIIGLIVAAMQFVNGGEKFNGWRELAVYGVLGAIFFFTGISLIRTTKDVVKNDEHIS